MVRDSNRKAEDETTGKKGHERYVRRRSGDEQRFYRVFKGPGKKIGGLKLEKKKKEECCGRSSASSRGKAKTRLERENWGK